MNEYDYWDAYGASPKNPHYVDAVVDAGDRLRKAAKEGGSGLCFSCRTDVALPNSRFCADCERSIFLD